MNIGGAAGHRHGRQSAECMANRRRKRNSRDAQAAARFARVLRELIQQPLKRIAED